MNTVIQNLNQVGKYDRIRLSNATTQNVTIPIFGEIPAAAGTRLDTNVSERNTFGSTKGVRVLKVGMRFHNNSNTAAIESTQFPLIAQVIKSGRLQWTVNNQLRFDYPVAKMFSAPNGPLTSGWAALPNSLAGELLLNVPIDFLGYAFNLNLTYFQQADSTGIEFHYIAEGYELLDERAFTEAKNRGSLS